MRLLRFFSASLRSALIKVAAPAPDDAFSESMVCEAKASASYSNFLDQALESGVIQKEIETINRPKSRKAGAKLPSAKPKAAKNGGKFISCASI